MRFRPISKPASGLFVPYLGWLTFATVLTTWFCVKNR
ncbi:MAG: tryptophan-rich sensory protein [Actinobacteria bacterium]|nr:tryptophan-rich sensory protein [Actinomycetota bacterium]